METRKIACGTARSAMLSTAIACCLGVSPTDDLSARTSQPRRPTGGDLLFVQNCDDSGPGSLRDTIAQAVSGDSIDLAQMGCSLITLTSGAIEVPQPDLTIKYSNTAGRPTISGEYLDRVFHHTGAGTFELDHLIIENGKYVGNIDSYGGCIISAGNVTLNASLVTHCDVENEEAARGGGLFVSGALSLNDSAVTYCRVHLSTTVGELANGGGLTAHLANISYSTISHNVVDWPGFGGGLSIGNGYPVLPGAISIDHTTISDNSAYDAGAGFIYNGQGAVFTNVTITGNTAAGSPGGGTTGGLVFYQSSVELHNVTIADNFSNSPPSAISALGINMTSTIIADNSTRDPNGTQIHGTLVGDHNLVFGLAGTALPSDTVTSDPLLLPLVNNGGSTATMAVHPDSPAIDAGAASASLQTDQRGAGYARVVGIAPDIGAFERQGPNDGDYIQVGNFDPP